MTIWTLWITVLGVCVVSPTELPQVHLAVLFFPSSQYLCWSSPTWPVLCLVCPVSHSHWGEYHGNGLKSIVHWFSVTISGASLLDMRTNSVDHWMLSFVVVRFSRMASAPTSKYNSHSLENESIKRVSCVFSFICASFSAFLFLYLHIGWSFPAYWIISLFTHIRWILHYVWFYLLSYLVPEKTKFHLHKLCICKSFHVTSSLRTSVLWTAARRCI